ncbi:cupin domain-containing protein [Desulfurivibrio dismutans]|uniref:cupin domain-containing protein n=1 Tax=Desulfurivibrio dismutans TaxID=1398908 RepID=UPI0023DAB3F5|nr:cupin domain-containing protein [Desulfurivibrio alkaliphilus]MDF1614408.1 cupin domain-containing protein [Desulfurivibrio alkaliphilus]
MSKSSYREIKAYITKDGSEIRELMHPAVHGNTNQSLAEARVPPGSATMAHRHRESEEIYHFTAGRGMMGLGEATFPVAAGDTVAIRPGVLHWLENPDPEPLVVLCACSPAYSHEDTELAL